MYIIRRVSQKLRKAKKHKSAEKYRYCDNLVPFAVAPFIEGHEVLRCADE